jgi:hypothetical protein
MPDMAAASFAADQGACQSTSRSRRSAGENRSAVSMTVMAAPFE